VAEPDETQPVSVFAAVGGQAFFDRLCAHFYAGVADDPVLRPLYPDDLADAERWLALFLGQYWGGPTAYGDERGHPRLRMRHAPFAIGPAERNAWYRHMSGATRVEVAALDHLEPELQAAVQARFLDYFATAADHMVNT
jgi:hemoglobin